MGGLWKGGAEWKEQDRGVSAASGYAEEALEVTVGDFEEVGGGEAEGVEKAFGVAREVKRKMAGSGGRHAGEGEVL